MGFLLDQTHTQTALHTHFGELSCAGRELRNDPPPPLESGPQQNHSTATGIFRAPAMALTCVCSFNPCGAGRTSSTGQARPDLPQDNEHWVPSWCVFPFLASHGPALSRAPAKITGWIPWIQDCPSCPEQFCPVKQGHQRWLPGTRACLHLKRGNSTAAAVRGSPSPRGGSQVDRRFLPST